jgi:Protein with unknown function (DUF469).
MEVRINKNYDFKKNEDCFGLSIKVDGGHRYCKYPVHLQSFTTMDAARAAMAELLTQLSSGATLVYPNSVSKGINKVEQVMIKGVSLGFELSYDCNGDEDTFLERFYSFIEGEGLDCNGGNKSFAITKSEGTVTEAERKAVIDWLAYETDVKNICVNKLVALDATKD